MRIIVSAYQRSSSVRREEGGSHFVPLCSERMHQSLTASWCFHVLRRYDQVVICIYRFASISTSYSTSPFSSCTNERRTRVSPAPKETRPIFLSPTKSQLKGKKRQGGRERIIVASSHPTPDKASQGLVWATIRHNKNPSRNLPPHIPSFQPKAMYPLHTLSR